MPVMNGFEATRQIRKEEENADLLPSQIIALTGLGSEAAQIEASAAGFDMYLKKPVKLKEIRAILNQAVPRGWKGPLFSQSDLAKADWLKTFSTLGRDRECTTIHFWHYYSFITIQESIMPGKLSAVQLMHFVIYLSEHRLHHIAASTEHTKCPTIVIVIERFAEFQTQIYPWKHRCCSSKEVEISNQFETRRSEKVNENEPDYKINAHWKEGTIPKQ
jgi:response regulator RpfG family c-di-GMP phosphodiesterase